MGMARALKCCVTVIVFGNMLAHAPTSAASHDLLGFSLSPVSPLGLSLSSTGSVCKHPSTKSFFRLPNAQSGGRSTLPSLSRPGRKTSLPPLRATASTSSSSPILPVTLLGGFLGTGKTTVLKHILENKEGLKVGIVVNDVAEVNIDAKLVRGSDAVAGSSTIELQNGCACCSVSDELFSAVQQIVDLGVKRGEPFDHLIIELSGVAEPAVVKANFEDARRRGLPIALQVDVSNVLTVVDTSSFVDEWMTQSVLAEREDISGDAPDACAGRRPVAEFLAEQIEAADRVVLNKVDMASSKELTTARSIVQGLLQAATTDKNVDVKAKVVEATYGKVPLSFVLPLRAKPSEGHAHGHEDEHGHEAGHAHSHEEACSDPTCDDPSHQAAQEECSDPECTDSSHSHGHSHAHSHASGQDTTAKQRLGIETFVYRARRPFAEERLLPLIDAWPVPSKNLSYYLTSLVTEGVEAMRIKDQSVLQPVVRSKGFLWMSEQPRQQLYWSHAGRHFALEPAGKWWTDLPESVQERAEREIPEEWARVQVEEFAGEFGDRRQELVFIGAGMDETAIRTALDACLLKESEMGEFRERLQAAIDLEKQARFTLGDKVMCRLQDWMPGTVLQVGYREPDWPMSKPDAPYQVQLETGALIWVPQDSDDFIRAR